MKMITITKDNTHKRRNVISQLEKELIQSNFSIELYLGSGLKFTSQRTNETTIKYLEKINGWKIPLHRIGKPLTELFAEQKLIEYKEQQARNGLPDQAARDLDERISYLQLLERVFNEDMIIQIKEYLRNSQKTTNKRIRSYDQSWEYTRQAEKFLNLDNHSLIIGRIINIATLGIFRRSLSSELDNFLEAYIGWKAVSDQAKTISEAIDKDAEILGQRIKLPNEATKMERVSDLYSYISNESVYHTRKLELLLDHAIPFYGNMGRIIVPDINQMYQALTDRIK